MHGCPHCETGLEVRGLLNRSACLSIPRKPTDLGVPAYAIDAKFLERIRLSVGLACVARNLSSISTWITPAEAVLLQASSASAVWFATSFSVMVQAATMPALALAALLCCLEAVRADIINRVYSWKQPRAAVVQDTLWIDGGQIWEAGFDSSAGNYLKNVQPWTFRLARPGNCLQAVLQHVFPSD